jgi:hypothetical protein
VGIASSHEPWNIYLLQTGDKLKTRIYVTEVYRIPWLYDHEGNPVYEVSTDLTIELEQKHQTNHQPDL